MKKITIIFVLAMMAAVSGFALTRGDINGDGAINVTDVTALINRILGTASYSDDVCDVDGNGTVNVSDVTSLINNILGEDQNDPMQPNVTGGATNITKYSATVTGWANLVLESEATDLKVGFIYCTSGTPTKNNGTQVTVSKGSVGSDAKYSANLTGLQPSTTYYYCSFTYQSGVWFYGNVKSFTTKDMGASFVTGNAAQITCFSAEVDATLNIAAGSEYSTLSYGICYGKSENPTTSSSKIAGPARNADGWFSVKIGDLTAGTTYYYRPYAIVDGYTYYGEQKSFTTKTLNFVTGNAAQITCFSAKVPATVVAEGLEKAMTYGICYGKGENPTLSDKSVQGSNKDANGNYSVTLKALEGGMLYYVRPYATVDGITYYGSVSSFTTAPDNVVTTGDYDAESGKVKSKLTMTGGAFSTLSLGVCYSQSQKPTVSDGTVTTTEVDDENYFAVTLPLSGGTWYYRAYVMIDGVAHYGAQKSAKVESPYKYESFTVGGVSFEMVSVEGGTFTMGATIEQGSDADSNEKPTHQVTLSSYSIGKTEVTQALWEAVMGKSVSQIASENGWKTYGVGADYPMYYISWDDCQEFIRKLNALTGQTFRLPTEAEWEYAARGGSKSRRYKYSGSNTIGDVAWYRDNSGSKTHPVGTKAPNELGIYDMSGNVWEWCSDWYGSYSSASQTNPKGPNSGYDCVFRGGGWGGYARDCRVSDRSYNYPDTRYNYHGVRLAL